MAQFSWERTDGCPGTATSGGEFPIPSGQYCAEYYYHPSDPKNSAVTGVPAFIRTEGVPINHDDWGMLAPAGTGLLDNNFSVRWQGWLVAPKGKYVLYVHADDGANLFIDHKQVIDGWSKHETQSFL